MKILRGARLYLDNDKAPFPLVLSDRSLKKPHTFQKGKGAESGAPLVTTGNIVRIMQKFCVSIIALSFVYDVTIVYFIHKFYRRQTTEEREAERQSAQRLINQLQQEALAHTPIPAPDALCLRNASLFALHSLQARLQSA